MRGFEPHYRNIVDYIVRITHRIWESKGGYMGLTSAGEVEAEMRIVDLYRREGDKLAENWIFIDNLHFLQQLGIDLLERQERLSGTRSS